MNSKRRSDFGGFLKSLGKSVGALIALPLASQVAALFQRDLTQYFFPPIGDFTILGICGLVGFSIAAIFFAYLLIGLESLKRVIGAALFISLVAFVSYISLASCFIRKIDVPSENRFKLLSVGYERTAFAIKYFPEASDWQMLTEQGPREEEVQRLWTIGSILKARAILLLTFYTSVVSWVFAFSCVTAWDITKSQIAEEPRENGRNKTS